MIRPAVRRLALVPAIALALAACGTTATPSPEPSPSATPTATPAPTPSPTPPPTPEPSPSAAPGGITGGQTGRVEVADAGLAVTLPDGWMALPVDEAAIQAMLDALPADSPYADILQGQGQALLAGAMSLLAFDTAITSIDTAGSNLSIITQPMEIPPSLMPSIVEAALAQLPNIVGEPTLTDVTVDGVSAVRADFSLTQEVEGLPDPITLDAMQLYLSANGRFVVMTVGIRDGAPDVRDQILSSVELLT